MVSPPVTHGCTWLHRVVTQRLKGHPCDTQLVENWGVPQLLPQRHDRHCRRNHSWCWAHMWQLAWQRFVQQVDASRKSNAVSSFTINTWGGGGIDTCDHKIYHVSAQCTIRRYWKMIFFNLLDMALLNSYELLLQQYICNSAQNLKVKMKLFWWPGHGTGVYKHCFSNLVHKQQCAWWTKTEWQVVRTLEFMYMYENHKLKTVCTDVLFFHYFVIYIYNNISSTAYTSIQPLTNYLAA